MKKLNRYFAMLLLAVLTATVATAKSKVSTIYAFGFAASFNDSTVYFSDIQEIPNAYLDAKSNFLLSRENYSYQLRDYLNEQGQSNRTCVIIYAQKRKDVEKKFVFLRKRYTSSKKGSKPYEVKYLPSNEFRFKTIVPYEVEAERSNEETQWTDATPQQ